MIIDAKDLIAGRLSSYAAKQALLGEEINIINSELAVITGNKKDILAKYKSRADKGGPHHGPFLPKTPDRFLKRIIRGMLPHKQAKGINALKKIKCYIGFPEEFQGKETETLKKANITKLQNLKYLAIKEICKQLKK